MDAIGALFANGGVVALIIGLMLAEGVALALWHRRTGRGIALPELAVTLASGMCLLLALGAALVGAAWPTIALWLVAALVAHVADLARRWRR